MFISDFAIQRPIVTITAMVALVAFGIAALILGSANATLSAAGDSPLYSVRVTIENAAQVTAMFRGPQRLEVVAT